MPLAAVGLPISVYIAPLYADNVGLGRTVTGTVFMVLRFWDIFTDAIMGIAVDRIKSPWGRVRHWILMGVPILCLGAYFIYMPPQQGVGWMYFAGWLVVFYVGFTLIQTAYQAWAPAIATDYDDRTRIFKWREFFNIGALIALLVIPSLIGAYFELDRFAIVAIMGAALIVTAPLTAIIASLYVPDPFIEEKSDDDEKFKLEDYKEALSSGPLWRILAIETLVGLAIASTAANYLDLAKVSFGVGEAAGSILVLFFISGIVTLPWWMRMAERTEKHIALRWILGLTAFAYLSWLLLAQIGGPVTLIIGAILSGMTFGSPFALVRSMLADATDETLLRTGKNRAGLYYSFMTGAYKLGAGLAVGITYPMAEILVGFDPRADNSPAQIFGFELIFVLVPFFAYLGAMAAAWSFPITRSSQKATRDKLASQSTAN
ncbi:MAG: MFS transporter [Pseudomonadota bacterium]